MFPGAGSNFSKGEWYRATGDEGWTDPESLDFLAEKNMEKYRRQRRAIGPAYTEHAMREYEPRIDEAVQKDIDIMHQRAGESVDIDVFLNLFASGQYPFSYLLIHYVLKIARLSVNGNILQDEKSSRAW